MIPVPYRGHCANAAVMSDLYYTQQAKKSKLTVAAMTAWEEADERAEAA
jgi:hypothetical protein